MSPGEFERFVLDCPVRTGPFRPFAHHNRDGDCFEFIGSNESYRGQWLGPHLTLYIGEESGKVIGVLVEGVSELVANGLIASDRPLT